MKPITFITVLCLWGICGHTQSPFDPLEFKEIETQWSRIFIDSSRIGQSQGEGNIPLGYYNNVLKLGDSIGYWVFFDRIDNRSGTYIEKVNLATGELIWESKFDSRTTGFREFPAYFGIGDDGTLELVVYRDVISPPSPIWIGGQLAVRNLDPDTGEELSFSYDTNYSDEDLVLFAFVTSRVLKKESDFVYFRWSNFAGGTEFIYPMVSLDKQGNLFRKDTLNMPRNVEENYVVDFSNFFELEDGFATMHNIGPDAAFSNPPFTFGADDFTIYFNLLSSDLSSVETIEISEQLPYRWSAQIWDSFDDLLLVRTLDSFDLRHIPPDGIRPFVNFSLIDRTGSLISDIDFGQPVSHLRIWAARIPNSRDFLFFHILNPFSAEKLINVWIHKSESGTSNLVKTLELEEDAREINLMDLEVLENGDVLMTYSAQSRDPETNVSQYLHNAAVRFHAEDLGLTTAATGWVNNSLDVHLRPNPFRNFITAEFSRPLNGVYTLFDLNGKRVLDGTLKGQTELQLDGSGLPAGTYILSIRSEDKLWAGKVIKME